LKGDPLPVELLLNPTAAGYEQIQRALRTELQAIKGIKYTESKIPPPPNTLDFTHEVVRLLLDYGPTLKSTIDVASDIGGTLALIKERAEEGGIDFRGYVTR
jgi:hypothetical protein